MQTIHSMQQQAITNPETFWAEAAQGVSWHTPWDKVLDASAAPLYRWFSGAKLNTCYNAVDRHVEAGHGEQVAIYYDSPVTNRAYAVTYAELQTYVARLASALLAQGVEKGDRVVIYMPMIPETLYAMLACARIGAVHSVVFGGFAAAELASRIDDAQPKLVLSASCGIEPSGVVPYKPLLDNALELANHKVGSCLIFQRPQCEASLQAGRDQDWFAAQEGLGLAPCTPIAATDPLYILYTSGTTGSPKGVVRDNGGHAVALTWSMKAIYDIDAGDTFWAASDVGWVVGHSYIVYAPLLARAATVLYEGKPVGTPDPGAFWRVIEQYRVKSFFTAPTAIRAIKREDPTTEHLNRYNLDCLKAVYLAGERCDPDTLDWAMNTLQVPVVDHWWQTETGWAICANPLGIERLPIKSGSPSLAVPGYQVQVLDDEGNEVAAGESGAIAIRLPLPPGTLSTLWGNDERYIDSYLSRYSGYYLTGDAGYQDDDGYLYIMSRIDDIINVAGHRLSTGRFEEVLAQHPAVAEVAVIGVADKLKGQLPLGLVVLKNGVEQTEDQLYQELITLVRREIGPVAAFKLVSVISKLPKTRSGKILRGTMRKMADNQDYVVPATIEDPAALDLVHNTLVRLGYGKGKIAPQAELLT